MNSTCDLCLNGDTWRCKGWPCANAHRSGPNRTSREKIRTPTSRRATSKREEVEQPLKRVFPTGTDPLSVLLRSELEQDYTRYRLDYLQKRVSGEKSPLTEILDIPFELR